MVVEILPASALVGLAPQVAIEAYGLKAQGYVALIEIQPESPVPYEVPDAFAIPNRLHGGYTKGDIQTVFEKLTAGLVGFQRGLY